MSGADRTDAQRRSGGSTRSRPMLLSQVPVGGTGFRGVHRQADKRRFRAVIEVAGVRRHLGYFIDPRDAARAYDGAATTAWGASAILNFPEA